jgi:hypothetical protein
MKLKVLALFVCLIAISCSKDDADKLDTQMPEINILAPDTSHYKSETNLPVIAEVTENDQLHDIRVEITNLMDSTLAFSTHTHQHQQSTLYETSMWLVPHTEAQQYEVKIIATDHAGNQASETRVVTVVP